MTHVLQSQHYNNTTPNELPSKRFFDSVEPINDKPTVGTVGLRNSDAGASDSGLLNTPIISDTPNSYKRRGSGVSKNFVQLVRSNETLNILKEDPKSFLLLTYISIHASRGIEESDVLESSECFLSEQETPKKCGLTTKEYRGAKARLIKQGLIVEIYNPSWHRKKNGEKPSANPEHEIFKKRAIKRAIKSCIVKLCNTDVYDINEKQKGDQKGDQRAIKGRSKGDIQEGKEREEDKKKTTPLPPKGGDGVSFSEKGKEEGKIHVHRDAYMSQDCLEECIKMRGDLETVKRIIDEIIDWPGRKYPITEWASSIKKWKLKNVVKDRLQENEQYGKVIESKFSHIREGWSVRHYRCSLKDDVGLLFECLGSAYSDSVFVSYVTQDFKEKVKTLIQQKNMREK